MKMSERIKIKKYFCLILNREMVKDLKRILFDETHDEYMIINGFAKDFYPEGESWKSLYDLLSKYYNIEKNTNQLSEELLQDYDILVLGFPREELQPREIRNIINFVEKGGGLLILHEHGEYTRYFPNNINKLSGHFGIIFNTDIISDKSQHYKIKNKEYLGGINEETPKINNFLNHPILEGVKEFYIIRGCSIDVIPQSLAKGIAFTGYLSKPKYAPVIAISEYGKGHVVAIGDTNLFGDLNTNELSLGNISQLTLNIFEWLHLKEPYALSIEKELVYDSARRISWAKDLQMRYNIKNEKLFEAIKKVPRSAFIPSEYKDEAYEDIVIPLTENRTLSTPGMIAIMLDALDPKPFHHILQLYSKSGYCASLIAEMTDGKVHIKILEDDPEVFNISLANIKKFPKYLKVIDLELLPDVTKFSKFSCKWDRIIIWGAIPEIQYISRFSDYLTRNGKIIVPVGRKSRQVLYEFQKEWDRLKKKKITECVFSPIYGRYGFKGRPFIPHIKIDDLFLKKLKSWEEEIENEPFDEWVEIKPEDEALKYFDTDNEASLEPITRPEKEESAIERKKFLIGMIEGSITIKVVEKGGTLEVTSDTGGSIESQEPSRRRCDDTMLKAIETRINEAIEIARKISANKTSMDPESQTELREKLVSVGKAMYSTFFTKEIADLYRKIKHPDQYPLRIGIDIDLIHFPWELIYDIESKEFLCLKQAIGRFIITPERIRPTLFERTPKDKIKFLIIGDPAPTITYENYKQFFPSHEEINENLLGNWGLPGARDECNQLSARLKKLNFNIEVDQKIGKDANLIDVNNAFGGEYDFIHYCGHTVFDTVDFDKSGLLLNDGLLSASTIKGVMYNADAKPILIFVNGCESSRAEYEPCEITYDNKTYGLATSFISSHINYIGAQWEIHDLSAVDFAAEFYNNMLNAVPCGESLRKARQTVFNKYGIADLTWAAYILYGNPSLYIKFV